MGAVDEIKFASWKLWIGRSNSPPYLLYEWYQEQVLCFSDNVVAAISLLADSSFPFAALYLPVLVLVVWGSQFYVVLFIFTSLVWFCSLAFWWPFVLLVHLPLMNKILPISKINKSISLLGQPLKLTMLYAKNK
jgi:hypothetical protein